MAFAKNIVDLEEMDRVKTLDTGHNFKPSNQSSAEESLKALGELSRAQYFYRKLHEKINHGTVFDGVANMHVMKTHTGLSSHHFHRQNVICTRAVASTAFTPGIQGTLNDFFLCVFKCAAINASSLCRSITLDFGRGGMLFKD